MMKKINKIIILCICLILAVFLYSCRSTCNEGYHQADSHVPVEDITNGHEDPSQTALPQGEPPREEPSQSDPYWEIENTLQFLLDTANERRLGIEKVSEEVVRELAYSLDFVFYDLSPLMPDEPQFFPSSVTPEEAIEDAEVLFDVLRYVYGGYEYFGGDEVFEPAREQVIEDILQSGDALNRNTLYVILRTHLSPIIRDFHFYIGRTNSGMFPLGPYYSFLVSSDVFFDNTDLGFYNRESGLYLEEIEGYDIADVMRLQLDESGQIFYAPVVVVDGVFGGVSYALTMVYADGTYEQIELLVSTRIRSGVLSPDLLDTGDIPYLSLEWMMGLDTAGYGRVATEFLDAARLLRDEPVVILDLRGNRGGTPILPLEWMYLLTGEHVRENGLLFTKWNYEYEYPWTPHGDTPESNPYYISDESLTSLEFLDGYYFDTINEFHVVNLNERQIVEREQVLIVLVDRHTSSAGEFFTDLAFNVQNTLVIGQNTFGTLTCNEWYPSLQMLNSGISISLGRGLYLHPEGHFTEGVGFAPDIWVTGDALAATLAMLRSG